MEHINARLLNVRLNMKAKWNWISVVAAYARTDHRNSVRDKDIVRTALGNTVAEVSQGEYPSHYDGRQFSHCRNGGCGDDKVLGEYGLDMPSDKGRRLLVVSAQIQLDLVNNVSVDPTAGCHTLSKY